MIVKTTYHNEANRMDKVFELDLKIEIKYKKLKIKFINQPLLEACEELDLDSLPSSLRGLPRPRLLSPVCC